MAARIKSKLAREMMKDSVEEKFYSTREDVCEWFSIINREIFGDTLPEFAKIDIRRRRGYWGECSGYVRKNGKKYCKLSLNNYHRSKKHFIEVLAHECVHAYQWIHGDTMDHGMTFMTWKTAFSNHHIRLSTTS